MESNFILTYYNRRCNMSDQFSIVSTHILRIFISLRDDKKGQMNRIRVSYVNYMDDVCSSREFSRDFSNWAKKLIEL